MYQYRRKHMRYRKLKQADSSCPFCKPLHNEQVLLETEHSYVIPNRTTYDIWENHKVLDHLLVVPKRHEHSLRDLPDAELLDAMKICADYEANGYSVYARASNSPRRSVSHQHTHLIKIDAKEPRISLLVRKPYFLIRF